MPEQNTTGKCYSFRDLKFYAKNGFICLHDEETGEFFVLTRKEFLLRAQALGEEAAHMRQMMTENPSMKWLVADRVELQNAVDDMIACTREAKEQGDRDDPAVDAWFRRHRPSQRSKISMASAANFSAALPAELPRGQETGKIVTPDFSHSTVKKKLILPGE
jgi:hypothetical protein